MKIFYPENLPINEHRKSIINCLQENQVVVIAGDTGSGKTTQLPKMCLEAFPELKLLIGCTQPRRIATSTVATRVAEELGENGNIVGYKIRFHDHTNTSTKIKFMTDGVLLAETRQDRLLSRYGILIIDEAHERNLNIDFLIGYVKQLLNRRPDLKIIITSATIDTEAFSKHFNNAPVITVSGRTYPINVQYNPPLEDNSEEKDGPIDHCVKSVKDLFNTAPEGDILVFLPTERDIRECCLLLEKKIPHAVVLPMFGRLPASDQKKIFQSFKKVKIVVATNVAETSITVPGVRYVVDSGLARISHYNVRSKTTSLPVSKVSRASCDQRKGRCGRVGPGQCIRLYSEEDFTGRPEFTMPEIKRSNLAEVILQMISLGLGDPEKFPFIDPPHKSAIREGYKLLRELGALNDRMSLTGLGKMMADLPIDPCISRTIIEAKENNCLREIKIISSVLAIQDPRIRPADHEKEAEEAHKKFSHPHSDFMVLLNIWHTFHEGQSGGKSWSRLKKFCKLYFLSFQRMREWFDLHDQLTRITGRRKGFEDNDSEASYEQIHKSFLAGFARNIARKKQGKLYQGAHNKELMIFPGSHQFMKGGMWLLAASFIDTTRLYALTVATIEPEWIESVSSHLCKYSWSSPHWNKKTGQVIAHEKVSIWGLIIATGRKVNFGRRNKKNIAEARDIFIQFALVLGELRGTYPFLAKNLSLIKKWQGAEEKLRVRNILADDLMFHEFYENKIPSDVFDQKTFNRFLKKTNNQNLLRMSDSDVLLRRPDELELLDYPPTLSIGNMTIRLEYHFEPGTDNDGVTFRLPLDFGSTVSPKVFEWLVPGLLQEKLIFLLKALPKAIRKKLVPVSDTVNLLLDDMDIGTGSLYSALESSILKHFKILIHRSDWAKQLTPHLKARYLLFDVEGKEICSGRNLKQLLLSLATHDVKAPTKAVLRQKDQDVIGHWENSKHTNWNFSGLPATITTYTPQGEVAGFFYSTLIALPEHGCVKVTFKKNSQGSEKLNREAMLFLYRIQFADQYKALKKMCKTALSGPSTMSLIELGKTKTEIIDELLEFILTSVFGPLPVSIFSERTFGSAVEKARKAGLFSSGQKICQNFIMLLRKRRTILEHIGTVFSQIKRTNPSLLETKADFYNHLDEVFPKDLLLLQPQTSIDFNDVERGLRSLSIRLERFHADPAKDTRKNNLLAPYVAKLHELEKLEDDLSEAGIVHLQHFRAMINEYRISLFSPEIKTRIPVSPKKLDQLWMTTRSKY